MIIWLLLYYDIAIIYIIVKLNNKQKLNMKTMRTLSQ